MPFDNAGTRLALAERLGIQRIVVDSAGTATPAPVDTSTKPVNRKSPLAAVLLSLLPAGGQIYNGSYWKVPIVWGVQGFFVYEWISSNKLYRAAQQQLSDSIAAGETNQVAGPTSLSLATLIDARNAALDQRDSYAWYIAGAYLLSMLDAYVDAELSGFDVSPNLSSTPAGRVYAVKFSMRF